MRFFYSQLVSFFNGSRFCLNTSSEGIENRYGENVETSGKLEFLLGF